MSGKRPEICIKFKNKEDNRTYEVGVIFLNDFGGGNFSPCQADVDDEKYPKMSLAKAMKLSAEKKGFLNVWANGGKGSRIAVTGGANEEF